MHEAGFSISLRTSGKTLGGIDLTTYQLLTFLQRGKDMSELLLLLVVIDGLTIDLDETVELHDLTLGHKLLLTSVPRFLITNTYRYRRLLNFGICHLTGDGTLPDQFVQTLLLSSTLNLHLVHIGGTDGLVSLLGTLRTGMILTRLTVFLSIKTDNLLLAGTQTEL